MSVDEEQDPTAPVHGLQKALAVAAVVIAVPVTLWGVQLGPAPMFVVTCLATAVPLPALRSPRHFVGTCLAVGLSLLGWGVLGVMFGMFVFWPSALVLLLAAHADPRRRPVAAKAVGGIGAAITTAALVGYAAFAWHFHIGPALAEPHTFRAVTAPGLYRGVGAAEEHLKPFGATHVFGTESDEGSYLDVRFTEQLSAPGREKLRTEISRLPGITKVTLCPVPTCG
ncbi:hypothetical protein ACFW7J_30395 [Streptomyces sp. NPDC059525]|uniref:hypothetical protein n=1 Tax=Streptomyces sp. NPDC059525 TaxID=3346857 RepID=UPI0036B3F239